jgi:hypothetical protein
MKKIFPTTDSTHKNKIYKSKMITLIFLTFIIGLSMINYSFIWVVNWIVLPFILFFTVLDFISFIVFKNHIKNNDKTIQSTKEFSNVFSKENLKKSLNETNNSYFNEVETVTSSMIFVFLIILDYKFFALIVATYFFYDNMVIKPFVKDYIKQ